MKIASEFLFTLIFTFVIGMAAAVAGPFAPLAIGLTLVVVVYAGASLSGAHYNPAVTLSLLATGEISASEAAQYIGAQCIASIVGFLVAGWITGVSGGIMPQGDYGVAKALVVEAMGTFILVVTIFFTAVSKKAATPSVFGFTIGFVILALILAGGPVSGAGYNPAVATGATIANVVFKSGSFSSIWIYWLGPIVGGVAGAFASKAILKLQDETA